MDYLYDRFLLCIPKGVQHCTPIGGQCSTPIDSPRLVAGFSDAYFEESDGSAGSFFGTFVALSEPFRVSGK